jgi:hypothetical protein
VIDHLPLHASRDGRKNRYFIIIAHRVRHWYFLTVDTHFARGHYVGKSLSELLSCVSENFSNCGACNVCGIRPRGLTSLRKKTKYWHKVNGIGELLLENDCWSVVNKLAHLSPETRRDQNVSDVW